MFCQKCGKENPNDAAFCNSCGSNLKQLPEDPALKNKHDEVIKAKINTRKNELDNIGHLGPIIFMFVGIFFLLFALLYSVYLLIPGIILIPLGYWWANKREIERIRLEGEVKELEAELS